MAVVDPRVYGDALQQAEPQPFGGGMGGAGGGVDQSKPFVQLDPALSFKGTLAEAQGNAVREEAARERAGILASMGAGMLSSYTAGIYRAVTDPDFPVDAGFDARGMREHLPFIPDDGEAEYIDGARSGEEWRHRLSRLEDIRKQQQVMGDNPISGILGTLGADVPLYFMTGSGVLSVTQSYGKAAGAAVGAVAGGGVPNAVQSAQPVSTEEIVFGMALEAAVPLVTLGKLSGKLEKVDPDFPDEVIKAITPTDRVKPRIRLKPAAMGESVAQPVAKPHIKLKSALDNPDALADTPLTRNYAGLRDAVADLATNAAAPHIRSVMRLIAPHVPDGAIRSIDEATDGRVKAAFGPTSRAMAVTDELTTSIYVNPTKQVGQETMAHELLHTATMRKLADSPELQESFRALVNQVRISLRTDEGVRAVRGARRDEQEFFRRVFGTDLAPDVDEFLSYALTSPSFQRMLDGMDATGNWIKNKAPDAPKALTAFQKIAEWVAKLFGGTTKVAKAFEDAMRARAEAPKTLRTELEERLGSMFEPVDDALHPTHHTPEEVFKAVNNVVQVQADDWAKKVGEKIRWNVHRTLSGYGAVGKKVADLLVDNNMDLSGNSIESIHRAVRADLTHLIRGYEDQLRAAMAEDGFGLTQQIFKHREAMKHQQEIHQLVQNEMFRREQHIRLGKPLTFDNVDPRIKSMADSLDRLYKAAEAELKAAGVEGADAIKHFSGFHNRRWSAGNIVGMQDRYMALGLTSKEAHQRVVRLLARSMRKANNWDEKLSYNVAASTIDRALRKGLREDSPFVTGGNELAAQVRDSLRSIGVHGEDAQRVLDVVVGKQDEMGKAGFLKHRIDMDYSMVDMVDGQMVRVTDMIDNNITDIVNQYADGVSTQVAFARKGMPASSDITKLRAELMEELKRDPVKQKEAADVFDGSIAKLRGEPVGTDMGRHLRNMQVFTRLVALPWSGLWQSMEIATPMAKYGALKTIRYAVKELPGFKQLLADASRDPNTSQHLTDILSRMSSNNIRMRPFTQRLEDGYEISREAGLDNVLQHTQQLVPYANALKWVHHAQANIVGNLVTDVVVSAAKGDARAAAQLAKYGVDESALKLVKEAVDTHGLDVDKWPASTWDAARPAFAKMMDESVLHQRMGDTPAFALLNPVGKFIFTFRSFTLTAHNKVLSGTLARDGSAAASLLMLYQFPLSALAVSAQTALNGKPELSEEELAWKSVGQMGAFGLFTDLSKIISGDMQNFGSPALIAVDRGIKVGGHIADAEIGEAMKDGVGLVPLIALPAKIIGAGL